LHAIRRVNTRQEKAIVLMLQLGWKTGCKCYAWTNVIKHVNYWNYDQIVVLLMLVI